MRLRQSFFVFKPSSRFGIKLNKPLLSRRLLRWQRQDSNAAQTAESSWRWTAVILFYFFLNRSANKNLCREHKKNKTGTRRWEEQKHRLEDDSKKRDLPKRWRNQSGQKLQGADEWIPAEGRQVGRTTDLFLVRSQSFKPVQEHYFINKTLTCSDIHLFTDWDIILSYIIIITFLDPMPAD